LEEPLSALECLSNVVDPKGGGTNKHKYVVASQEQEVRVKMRGIVGVPLVYLKRSVMILEPMAGVTEQAREREEREKMRAGLIGRRGAHAGVKRKLEEEGGAAERGVAREESAPTVKRRKVTGVKGPNPLSVKKAKPEKKKTVASEVEDERATIRKASKSDPQAAEKAIDAATAVNGAVSVDTATDGPRKRKRKRKHPGGSEGEPEVVA